MRKQLRNICAGAILMATITSNTICLAAFGDVNLKYGSRGEDVKVLQQKLNSLGYWIEADGIFGPWTKKMVIKFQADNNINTTGVVGPITIARLKTATSDSFTESTDGNSIIATARQYMGTPYVWGGETPQGFDCSGFTQYVMKQNGINIMRTAAQQFEGGISVSRDNLQVGDLVFFTTYKPGASHVGFYIGNGDFIHASSAAHQVTISSLHANYYAEHYIGARRYQ